MDYEVTWTGTAVTDLETITTYIAEHNAASAERIATAIHAKVDLLRTVPLMGATYPAGSADNVRVVLSGKYRIFYRVIETEERVEILTVRHSARRPPEFDE